MAEVLVLMETVSLLIGTVEPLANRISTLAEKIKIFKSLPDSLSKAQQQLSIIKIQLENMSRLLSQEEQNLDDHVRENFQLDMESIHRNVNTIDSDVTEIERLFDSTDRKPGVVGFLKGSVAKLSKKSRRLFYSEQISSNIEAISATMTEVSLSCQNLTGFLGIPIHIQRHAAGASSKKPDEKYEPTYDVPTLPLYIVIDFSLDGDHTHQISPEARLKQLLINMVGCHTQQRIASAIGVEGMGGIGKTVVLTALGWEPDVRARFPDGVYFLQLGMDADDKQLRLQLAHAVRLSGGKNTADRIEETDSASEAAELTAGWFKGRTVLFLCDDLWNTKKCPFGYIDELKGLLRLSKQSWMVITTRDKDISHMAGVPFEISPRQADGPESLNMLVTAANKLVGPGICGPLVPETYDRSVKKILSRCAGVPLTLAVTGGALASLCSMSLGSWEKALEKYEAAFQCYVQTIQGRVRGYPNNFETTLRATLKVADEMTHSKAFPSDILVRFCILERQAMVHNSTLKKFWYGLNNDDAQQSTHKLIQLNLVIRVDDHTGQRIGVRLHDHVLDYCCEEAKRLAVYVNCFRQMLDSFIPPTSSIAISGVLDNDHIHHLGEFTRPWWEVRNSNDASFLMHNLIRLLVNGECLSEAVGILTDARWTEKRIHDSGIAMLLWDFEYTIRALQISSEDPTSMEVREALCVLRDACSDMDVPLRRDIKELAAQAHARLLGIDDNQGLLKKYLDSAKATTTASWLRAMSQQWQGPFGSRFVEIPVEEEGGFLAVNWLRGKIFVAAGELTSEIDQRARKVIRRWEFGAEALAISTDGLLVAMKNGNCAGVAVWDRIGDRKVWEREVVAKRANDSSSSTNSQRFGSSEGVIWRAGWSCDGSVLIIGGAIESMLHPDAHEGWAASLNAKSGATIFMKTNAHMKGVSSLATNRDGTKLVTGSEDGILKIWDTRTAALVWEHKTERLNPIRSLAVDANGAVVASSGADGKILLWRAHDDATGFELLREFEVTIPWHSRNSFALSQDGTRIMWVDWNGRLEVRNVTSAQTLFKVHPPGNLRGVVSSSDGRQVVAIGTTARGNFVWIWDTTRNMEPSVRQRVNSDPIESVAFVGSNRVLAITGNELQLWDTRSATISRSQAMNDGHVERAAMSADGKVLVTASWHSMGTDSVPATVRWWDGRYWTLVREDDHAHGGIDVRAIAVSADGTRVATVGADGTLKLWDGKGKPLYSVNTKMGPGAVSMSNDGGQIVVSAGRRIQLWEYPFKAPVDEVECADGIHSLAVSGDGKFVVSGHYDGSLIVRHWASLQAVWALSQMHEHSVWSVRMNEDGRCIVSIGLDKKLKVWTIGGRFYEEDALVKFGGSSSMSGPVVGSRVGEESERDGRKKEVGCTRRLDEVASVTLPQEPRVVAYLGGNSKSNVEHVVVGDETGDVLTFEVIRNN